VALGLHNWEALDIVLSGINLGSNLGNGMWHSGTLAAAKQAVLFGCRGIALSAPTHAGDPDFESLEPFVERVLERLLPARELSLVNVNFPQGHSQGLQWTRQSVRQYDGHVVPGKLIAGRSNTALPR
jgi:5'-nucleotidase